MSSKKKADWKRKFSDVRLNTLVCLGELQQLFASIYDAMKDMDEDDIVELREGVPGLMARGMGFYEWRELRDIAIGVGMAMNTICTEDSLAGAKEFTKTPEGGEYVKKATSGYRDRYRRPSFSERRRR
jgi:hypothetical protein